MFSKCFYCSSFIFALYSLIQLNVSMLNVIVLQHDFSLFHLLQHIFGHKHIHFLVRNANIFIGVISADELPSGFDEEQQSTFIERLGASTDKLLAEFFCWWGTGTITSFPVILRTTVHF